jgi:hypothetical protein
MFPRNKDNISELNGNVIQRRTFEQLELEQMSEILDEMREEIKSIKESIPDLIRNEFKSFRAKFESWENINSMMDDLKQRELELKSREGQKTELRTILPELRIQIHQTIKEAVEMNMKEVREELKTDSKQEVHIREYGDSPWNLGEVP